MDKNKVLAIVGEKEITQNDVDSIMNNLDPQTSKQYSSDKGKEKILDELINQELIYLDAVENQFENEEEYKAEVEKFKAGFLRQYAVSKTLRDVKVEEEEVKSFYALNHSQFKRPEMINSSHILVDDEDKANEVLKELDNGMAFEEAAEKYSKCPSKSEGGNLGYSPAGKLVPEFEKVAFSLAKDEISKPVKTQFGYHIIKLVDRKAESVMPFDEVKDQLSKHLLAEKQEKAYLNKASELKEKYKSKVTIK